MKSWKLVLAVALVAALVSYAVAQKAGSSAELRSQVRQQILQLVAEHQRLEKELASEPFAEAGKHPLETYLARIRKDGLPAHSEMRRRLASLAEDNTALLALAEAYEPVARSEAYSAQLKQLRTYVITWNDRWNGVFETFMAGGNLAGGEPEFPAGIARLFE